MKGVVACVLVAAAGWLAWGLSSKGAPEVPASAASSQPPVIREARRVEPDGREARVGEAAPPMAALPPSSPGVPASAASAVLPAAETMADARLHGERRAPPIDPPEPAAPRAEPWQVADPVAYQARERRLARELDARFVTAAQARLGEQRAALAQLQAQGASPQDLAQAEDKIRHLEAAQAALISSGAASAP
jgi:hypothetical protein